MSVLGIRETRDRLLSVRNRAEGLQPIWPEVGDIIADTMVEQFATAGKAGGRPWAPLKPDYLAWKVAHGYDPDTLLREYDMAQSLTSRPMDIEVYRPTSADFGSTDPKLPYHMFGTRNMPARPVLFWHEPMTTKVIRKIKGYITVGRIK